MATESRAGLRILVVDDSASIREPLRAILEEEGFHVTLAAGGLAGIEALSDAERRGGRFSVVLTDFEMPEVDGGKVAAAAKRLKPPIPVILLSGRAEHFATVKKRLPEVDRILSKPPKLAELRRALAELLR